MNKINRVKNKTFIIAFLLIFTNAINANSQISGPNKSCLGDTKRYKTNLKSNNIWEVNGGYIVKNYTDSLDVHWLETSGTNIKLKHLNSQSGVYESYQLDVNVSNKTKPKITGKNSTCANTIETYSYSFPVSGFQPKWSAINGQIVSGESSNHVKVQWNLPGTGKLILTNTNPDICFIADTFSVSVIFLPNMQIFGRNEICKGQYETFSMPYNENYSYYWQSSKGRIYGSASLDEVTIVWDSPGYDSLKVTVYNNQSNCSRQYAKAISINDFPKVKLEQFEDICLTGELLKLSGGTPEGGTYGGGYYVTDGYFNVAFAGIGKHIITYSYTNKNGLCTGTDQKYIRVLKVPQKPFIFYENSVLYTNLNSGIQWYFNGQEIQGANQKTLHPNQSGYYSLKGKNELGCASEMSDSILIDLSNIEELNSNTYFIQDNKEIIKIYCKYDFIDLKMYSLLGRCVYKHSSNSLINKNNQLEIDMRDKKEAVYFIQLILANGESLFIKHIRKE